MTDRDWLKPKDVAAELGVPVVRVQRWLLAGQLRGRKIGGLWFVHRTELEAYDAERAESQRGEPLSTEPGRSLGSVGDDAERQTAFTVRPIEEGRQRASAGVAETAGRIGRGGSSTAAHWSVPADVAD